MLVVYLLVGVAFINTFVLAVASVVDIFQKDKPNSDGED